MHEHRLSVWHTSLTTEGKTLVNSVYQVEHTELCTADYNKVIILLFRNTRSLFARCHIRMLALWVVLLLSGTEGEAELQANKINKKIRFEFLFLFYLLRPHFSCVLMDLTCSSALSPGGGLSCDYIWRKNNYLWLTLLKGYCHLL